MDKNIDFIVFCLESYKQAHQLTGKAALQVFAEHNVFEYIQSFYDILHSTGQGYIVEDIDLYIHHYSSNSRV